MSEVLSGKVALVTGGSRGIGAAIARRLAAAGADVAVSFAASADKAQAVAADLERAGVRAAAYRADQGDPAKAAGLIDAVLRDFGQLDILVSSAGVAAGGLVDDPTVDRAALDRQFQVNVAGVAAAVRAAAPRMTDGGRIISIGSVLAVRSGRPGLSDYSATKAAVSAYTRGWARDLGPRGITVNAVQPGPVATDMNPADGDSAEIQRASVALGRFGQPEEIAAAVAFLASPEASFITGVSLDVDGGYNA
jgi:NAD(P)-dependent dehydrogenase (short-subunit alcohol dehydrogenase family)